MSETTSTGESIAYQPISGWAIAGAGISGLFTLLVLASAVVGLFQGAPVFFPIWFLALAALGSILSYIGQRHIETSENTRTGMKLARVGLWLGIVSGLSYLSYFYVTGWALETQANSFLLDEGEDSGFFPRIRKGGKQLNAAFLLTLPAHMRTGRWDDDKSMNEHHNTPTKDGGAGKLTQFRESPFVRIFFRQLGADEETTITPGKTLDWKYEKRSYAVRRIYHVKTKELSADLHVAAQSSEGESEGQGRKWYVNRDETFLIPDTLALTPLGFGMKALRERSRAWLTDWIGALNNGAAFPEIAAKDKTEWDAIALQAQTKITSAKVRDIVQGAFRRNDKNRLQQFHLFYNPGRPDFDVGKWETQQGRVRVYYTFQVTILEPGANVPLKVDINAAVETRHPVDIAGFTERTPAPEWNLVELRVTQALLMLGKGQ